MQTFYDMIENYGDQNTIVLRTYQLELTSTLGKHFMQLVSRPLGELMNDFKFIVFNKFQDIKRLDWPVGFHLIIASEIDKREFRTADIHYSGRRVVKGWDVYAGRFRNTSPQRRIRILIPPCNTFMIVIVHDSKENYGKSKISRSYGDDEVDF